MRNPILVTLLLSSGILLALTHTAALMFNLHYTYPWLDIPLHLLGGVVVALLLCVAGIFPRLRLKLTFLRIEICVLVIGLLWEAFELTIGVSYDEPGFIVDTVVDLSMDLVGGAIGYFIAQRLSTI